VEAKGMASSSSASSISISTATATAAVSAAVLASDGESYSAKVAGSSLYDVSSIRSYEGAGAFAGGIMFDGRQLAPQESKGGKKGEKSDSIDMSVFINCNDRSQVDVCTNFDAATVNQVHVYDRHKKCCGNNVREPTKCASLGEKGCPYTTLAELRSKSPVSAVYGVCRYAKKWRVVKVALGKYFKKPRTAASDAYVRQRFIYIFQCSLAKMMYTEI